MAADYILGIDYGNKRVGVAIAHHVARLPRPLTTLANSETLIADIQQVVDQESASLVVVGLPRGMDGGYTQQTKDVENFARTLATSLSVPVELADETLTSIDAETYLGKQATVNGGIDAMAASLILERYLVDNPREEPTS